jgi:hypothetical protein
VPVPVSAQPPTSMPMAGLGEQTSATPVPQPATGRRGHGFAYAMAGVAATVIVAVAAVVLATKGSSPTTPAAASTQSANSVVKVSQAATTAAAAMPTASSAVTTAPASASPAATNVLSYVPGTYQVNQNTATDLLGNTVTVDSVTVAGDHSVSVKLTYMNNSGFATQWSCSNAVAGEATLSTASGGKVSSTGSDCTKDPSKTENLPAGGTIDSEEYFASAPPGTGDWTFAIDSEPEFVGSTEQGFSIPTS